MQIIADRRALHQIPELDIRLPKTSAYVKNALEGLGCQVVTPWESAVCAFFDFGKPTALAFRADMDALPIQEKNDTPYASHHPGQMHACGHDGHTAILLELARRLNEKKALPHNILLVFQPAEETLGGARPLCETGIFTEYHVEAIFGLHIWPGLEEGQVFSRRRELMSRSSEVTVDISGRSAHIAKAEEAIDALMAGTEFYRRAVAMEEQLPEDVFRLLKFGKFQSGVVRNAISAQTHMEGSLRAFQDEVFETMRYSLIAIADGVDREFGTRTSLHFSEGYPAILNPDDLFRRAAKAVPFRTLEAPSMTSEDFSWYQRYLPGMFFFLGLGDAPALHSDNFDFDETLLLKGADFFEALAEQFV